MDGLDLIGAQNFDRAIEALALPERRAIRIVFGSRS